MPEYFKPKKFNGLDTLRAIAILLVFFWHYRQGGSPAWVNAVGGFGWTGVDLFFVLSGYLIGTQLLKKVEQRQHVLLFEFYTKRFFRIIPAYVAVLILYITIPLFHEREALPPLWRFLSFTQNFGLDLRKHGTFSHAWSLCIEEHFYLLLPLIVLLFVRLKVGNKAVLLLLLLFVAGFAVRWFNWQHYIKPLAESDDDSLVGIMYYKYIYYPTYNRLDGLLMGVGIAALFIFKPHVRDRLTKYGNILFFLGMAVLAASYFVCDDMYSFHAAVFGFPMVAVGYGLVVMAALSPSFFLYRMHFKTASFTSLLAFSIYLTHKQLIHLTRLALKNSNIENDSHVLLGICIVVAILGGIILHTIVERPFLKLREKLLNKK